MTRGAEAFTLDDLRRRPVISVEQAGQVLGLHRGAAYAAASRGDIATIRLGRRIVVPTMPLLRLLGADDLASSPERIGA